MTIRTTSRAVTFHHPFVLDGLPCDVPAGTYLVETEEELMDTVLSLAWKRVSTAIRLRTAIGTQDYFIDPEQLEAALLRDLAAPDSASSEAVAPAAHISRTRQLDTKSGRESRPQNMKEI